MTRRVIGLIVAATIFGTACSGDAGRTDRTQGAEPTVADATSMAGRRTRGDDPTAMVARAQPLANPAFGVKYDRFRELAASDAYLRSLPRGVTWYEVERCVVEPRPGEYDWRTVDGAVAETDALGWELVLKIRTGSCWATGATVGSEGGRRRMSTSLVPLDLAAHGEFVRRVVERYAPLGVHSWAIENEVNALNFWQSDADDYRRLARVVSDAVRAADDEAVVYDSGISSAGYGTAIARMYLERGEEERAVAAYNDYYARRFSTRADDYRRVAGVDDLRAELESDRGRLNLAFVDATFELAREGVFDVYQLHFYEHWGNLDGLLELLRVSLPPSMPVEALEVGLYNPDDPFDPTVHAAETMTTVALLLAAGVRRVVLLPLVHNPDGRTADEIRWGLLDPRTGRPRVAATMFSELAAAGAGTGAAVRLVRDERATVVAVGNPERSAVIAWGDGPTRLPARPEPLSGTRADGSRTEWGPAGLVLGPEPVVVAADVPLEAVDVG